MLIKTNPRRFWVQQLSPSGGKYIERNSYVDSTTAFGSHCAQSCRNSIGLSNLAKQSSWKHLVLCLFLTVLYKTCTALWHIILWKAVQNSSRLFIWKDLNFGTSLYLCWESAFFFFTETVLNYLLMQLPFKSQGNRNKTFSEICMKNLEKIIGYFAIVIKKMHKQLPPT